MAGKPMDPNYIGTGNGNTDSSNSYTPTYFNNPENSASTFGPKPFMQTPTFNFEITNRTEITANEEQFKGAFSAQSQADLQNFHDDLTFDINNMTFNN